MLDRIVSLIFLSIWSLFAVYLFLTYRVQRALKLRHNPLWVELGEPSLTSASPTSLVRFLSFCLSGRVQSLGDESLSRSVLFWRISAASCCAAVVLVFSVFLFAIRRAG